MSKDKDPETQLETKNEEEEDDSAEDADDSAEDSEDESEEDEDSEDSEDDEKEELRAENAKLKRLLKKKEKKKKKSKKVTERLDEDDGLRQTVESLKLSETKRQFGYAHGLSPEEVDKVFQVDPEPTAKTLKDPFVKAGLEAIRKKKRVEENTPSSSSKASPTQQKDFHKLSAQEKDKVWQKLMKQRGVTK